MTNNKETARLIPAVSDAAISLWNWVNLSIKKDETYYVLIGKKLWIEWQYGAIVEIPNTFREIIFSVFNIKSK